jgi:hypothetical protein
LQEIEKRRSIEIQRFSHHRSVEDVEQWLVLGEHRVAAVALYALSLNEFPQLDQVICRWYCDKQIAARREHPRRLWWIAAAMQRQHEIDTAIQQRQSPVGIRNNPDSIGKMSGGTFDGWHRQIDADASAGPGRQHGKRVAGSASEVGNYGRIADLERGCAIGDRVDQRSADA